MKKEVIINISGLQLDVSSEEPIELMTTGDYYLKNGKHYILYEEILEGAEERVKNVIKISPSSMDIIKKGVTNSRMLFEKNKKNLSCYSTPVGNLVIGIQANHFYVEEQENSIKVNVDYSLDINYEHMSDCRICVDVQSCTA